MHMLLFFPVRSSHLLDLDELPRSYSKHHQNVIRVQGKLFSQVLALARLGHAQTLCSYSSVSQKHRENPVSSDGPRPWNSKL